MKKKHRHKWTLPKESCFVCVFCGDWTEVNTALGRELLSRWVKNKSTIEE